MSEQRKRRISLSSVSPTTPKQATIQRDSDNMFTTPTSHHLQDDDSDTSPYALSFTQRAMNVEVTWEEKRTKSTPYKSKYACTPLCQHVSPPVTTCFDVEESPSDSPKGLFKFLIRYKRKVASQTEDDVQHINNNSTIEESERYTTIDNDTECFTPTEQVNSSSPILYDSNNLKQLLNDSEDMNLMLCSQKIEEEICNRPEPVIQAIASKGFSDMFSDDDDFLLANLDDPHLVDKKLPYIIKSPFARHKSIAIQPNSVAINETATSNVNKNTEVKSDITVQPYIQNKPLTPTSVPAPALVRHKSMPSPYVINSNTTRKCSAKEIAIKREIALAKLRLRKERLNNNK